MAQGPTVEFGGVFVARETETALLCRIGDKSHWVARSRLRPGSTVERPGDFGVLVLAWDFAVEFWDGAMSAKRRLPVGATPARAPSPLMAAGAAARRCSGWSPKPTSRRAEPSADMPRQAG